MKRTAPAKDENAYLAALPKDQRVALQKLRKIIKAAAPMVRARIAENESRRRKTYSKEKTISRH